MNVKIIPSAEFDRQFKRLAKKYKSLLDDYLSLSKELKKNPLQGSDLGDGVRKIRMAITSKGKGKSGGARVLTIYDKSEIENVSDEYIKWLISETGK